MPMFNPCSPCCTVLGCCEETCTHCDYVIVFTFDFSAFYWATNPATNYVVKYNGVTLATLSPNGLSPCTSKKHYIIGNLGACTTVRDALIAQDSSDCVSVITTSALDGVVACNSRVTIFPDNNTTDKYYMPIYTPYRVCRDSGHTSCCPTCPPQPFTTPRCPPFTAFAPGMLDPLGHDYSFRYYSQNDFYCENGLPLHCYHKDPPLQAQWDYSGLNKITNSIGTPCASCNCCNSAVGYDSCNCPAVFSLDTALEYEFANGCLRGTSECYTTDEFYDSIFDWSGYVDGSIIPFPITSGIMTISVAGGTGGTKYTQGASWSGQFCESPQDPLCFFHTPHPAATYAGTIISNDYPSSYPSNVVIGLPPGHDVVLGVDTFIQLTFTHPSAGIIVANYTISNVVGNDVTVFGVTYLADMPAGTSVSVYKYAHDLSGPAGPVTISFSEPVCAIGFCITAGADLSPPWNDFYINVDGTGGFSGTISNISISGSLNDGPGCNATFVGIRSKCGSQKINSITFGRDSNLTFIIGNIGVCTGA